MRMFHINGCRWYIKEVEQEIIKKEIEERHKREMEIEPDKCGRYLGMTWHDTQEIYLDKELPDDKKRKVLIHELTHCYIGCYMTHMTDKNYCEEDVCDIVSNSYDIIKNIVDGYFVVDK